MQTSSHSESSASSATSVWAATSPLLDGVEGVYLKDSDIAPLAAEASTLDPNIAAGPVDTGVGVAPYAVNPESAQRLWALSERLVS